MAWESLFAALVRVGAPNEPKTLEVSMAIVTLGATQTENKGGRQHNGVPELKFSHSRRPGGFCLHVFELPKLPGLFGFTNCLFELVFASVGSFAQAALSHISWHTSCNFSKPSHACPHGAGRDSRTIFCPT